MSFFQRVAALATMTLGIAALVGTSTPSFASQLAPSLNVPLSGPVPENTDLAAIPAEIAAPDVGPLDVVVGLLRRAGGRASAKGG